MSRIRQKSNATTNTAAKARMGNTSRRLPLEEDRKALDDENSSEETEDTDDNTEDDDCFLFKALSPFTVLDIVELTMCIS
jgi:hypothetical protein